jgi:hypothetical protein
MNCSNLLKSFVILCFGLAFLPKPTAWSQENLPRYTSYCPSTKEMIAKKADVDDPVDLMATLHPGDVLPPEV